MEKLMKAGIPIGLDSLIEACMPEFRSLERFPHAESESNQWAATPLTRDVVGVGATREEAVKQLWIALNA